MDRAVRNGPRHHGGRPDAPGPDRTAQGPRLRRGHQHAAVPPSAPSSAPAARADERHKPARPPIVLLAACALAVPLLGLAVFTLHSRQNIEESLANLNVITRIKTTQIEQWLAERVGDGNALLSSAGFAARIDGIRRTGDPAGRNAAAALLESYRTSYGYESIDVIDETGTPFLTLGPPHEITQDTLAMIPAAIAARAVRVGELHTAKDGRQHLDVVVPLLLTRADGERTTAGVVVMHIDPAKYLYPQLIIWPDTRDSGQIHLVRRDGDSVIDLNPSPERAAADAVRIPLTDSSRPSVAAVKAQGAGTVQGFDFRGVPVLAAFRPVKGTSWVLMARVDREEALKGARTLALWVSAVAFLAVLLLGVAIVLLWRTQRRADRLALADESARLFRLFYELPFIGMAITSPQTKRWVQFNDRLCEIFGYSREDLEDMTWADLTHPDDLQKDVAEFERVLRGETDGYAMDKRFVRRDGAIVHAAIDVRCRRRPDGSIDQFFATIQDITDRKAAEASILRLSQLYATLSRCNAAIVHCRNESALFEEICRIAMESGLARMAWIGKIVSGRLRPQASAGTGTEYVEQIDVSIDPEHPNSRGPIGTALREDRPVWCQDFQTDPLAAPWRDLAKQFGWGGVAALPLHKEGACVGAFVLYTSATGAFDEQARRLLGEMSQDISFALGNLEREARRIEAEAALQDNEERFRLLFETSLDACFLSDGDGTIFAANPAACRMLDRTQEEMIRLGRESLLDMTDPRLADALKTRRETGYFRGELTCVRSSGEKFPVEVSSVLYRDGKGSTRGSIVIRDISDRVSAEARLLEQLEELRRWHAAMLGREERVLELKTEVNDILATHGAPPRYPSTLA